jgi:hypothetical protein
MPGWRAMKDMLAEVRQSRDDWRTQAERLALSRSRYERPAFVTLLPAEARPTPAVPPWMLATIGISQRKRS